MSADKAVMKKSENLVIVFGPSCSGKSTLVKNISHVLPYVKIFDYDEILLKNKIRLLSKYTSFFELNSILGSALLHSIYYQLNGPILLQLIKNHKDIVKLKPKIEYLNDLLYENKELIETNSKNELIENASDTYKKGHFVLIDLGCGISCLNAFKDLSPLIILLYTPFMELFNRIRSRNEFALSKGPLHKNFLSWRSPLPVYRHFTEFFNSKKEGKKPLYLESLDKITVQSIIQSIYKTYPCYVPKEFINIKIYEDLILNNLNLHEKEIVEIYPQYDYDFVLTPSQILDKRILKILERRGHVYG